MKIGKGFLLYVHQCTCYNLFPFHGGFFKSIGHYVVDVFDENDVVVNDARFLDLPLLKAKVGKRIFQIHNPHLNNPLDN